MFSLPNMSGWFQKDVFRGAPFQPRGGMSPLGLPSIARLGARETPSLNHLLLLGRTCKMPAIVLLCLSGVPNKFPSYHPSGSPGCLLSYLQCSLYLGEWARRKRSPSFCPDQSLCIFLKRSCHWFSNVSYLCLETSSFWGPESFLHSWFPAIATSKAATWPPSFFCDLVPGSVIEAAGEDEWSTGDCLGKNQ